MDAQRIKSELAELHVKVAAVKGKIRRIKWSPLLLLDRRTLNDLVTELDSHYETYAKLDDKINWETYVSGSINDLIMASMKASILSSVRESVRALLSECFNEIREFRNQLNFQASLAVSVFAIIVAIVLGVFF